MIDNLGADGFVRYHEAYARLRRSGSGEIMGKNGKDETEPEVTPACRYDDELLSANWNPAIELLEWSCARTAAQVRGDTPGLQEDEVDEFLGRIYRLGN